MSRIDGAFCLASFHTERRTQKQRCGDSKPRLLRSVDIHDRSTAGWRAVLQYGMSLPVCQRVSKRQYSTTLEGLGDIAPVLIDDTSCALPDGFTIATGEPCSWPGSPETGCLFGTIG